MMNKSIEFRPWNVGVAHCSGVTYMNRVSGTLQLRSASTRLRSFSPIFEFSDSHGILRRCEVRGWLILLSRVRYHVQSKSRMNTLATKYGYF